jgi:excisionase family DNA binding protein
MSLDGSMAVPEVAKYLRVSVSTVYELLRAGELTGVRAKEQREPGTCRTRRFLGFATQGLLTRRAPRAATKNPGRRIREETRTSRATIAPDSAEKERRHGKVGGPKTSP